jgi:hypothetical protein
MGIEARYNISQAFAVGQLSERHAEKLIHAREAPDLVIAVIAKDALVELVLWQMLDQLSKDRFPGIHPRPSSYSAEVDYRMNLDKLSSNRKVAYRLFYLCMTASYHTSEKR